MKFSIPEPCSEDWSKMTPTEQGAFCQKCTLEVTDFTRKSAWEIKTILTEKIQAKQRVCGRIENHQLVQVNHDFIHWKSDQESFRAIWMFSLIAVFGLTLFSCQSTFSKEVVEKMNTTTLDLMGDTTNLVSVEVDSTSTDLVLDSFAVSIPWDIITGPHGGTVMLGGFGLDFEVITTIEPYCLDIIMGSMIGGSYPGETKDDPLEMTVMNSRPDFISTPVSQSPRAHERPVISSQRLDARLASGNSDFDAYISPNPVDESSKLFVTIPTDGTLELVILRTSDQRELHREEYELAFGNYQISINFLDFPKDEYEAVLNFEDQELRIPFEVFEKTTA